MSDLANLQMTDIAEFLGDSWETGVGMFNITFSDEHTAKDIVFG